MRDLDAFDGPPTLHDVPPCRGIMLKPETPNDCWGFECEKTRVQRSRGFWSRATCGAARTHCALMTTGQPSTGLLPWFCVSPLWGIRVFHHWQGNPPFHSVAHRTGPCLVKRSHGTYMVHALRLSGTRSYSPTSRMATTEWSSPPELVRLLKSTADATDSSHYWMSKGRYQEKRVIDP